LLFALQAGQAQELQARFSVVANRIGNNVDKKVFGTLQSALLNFVNNRKWTTETFQPQERIKCNFLLNLDQALGENVYKATLTVQAARPVYNTQYESPVINFQDIDVVFRYVEFGPIEFNENRVQGSDPLIAKPYGRGGVLCKPVLGMDADSFTPRGGDVYFQRAQIL
jgi:hypothetical protein